MQLKHRQEGEIFRMNIDPNELYAAIDETATRYAKKYGRMPTSCLISKKDVVNGEIPTYQGLTIEASISVLPGQIHMFSQKPDMHVTPGLGPEGRRRSNGAAWARNGKHKWQDWYESRQRRAPRVDLTGVTPIPGVAAMAWLEKKVIGNYIASEITPMLPAPVKIAGLLPPVAGFSEFQKKVAAIPHSPRVRAEGRFMSPEQNEFITRDGRVIQRPKVILLGPPKTPVPAVLPQVLQTPAEVMAQLAARKSRPQSLAAAAHHGPPADPFSREAVRARMTNIAMDPVSDLIEAVEFAVEHPDNAEAQVLPGGLELWGDANQLRLVDPKKNRAVIVAVQLNPGQVYRFVARKDELRKFLEAA